ncbi:HAD-IA family hydrolase [Methylomonas paludis]|uniref:HAD-IA family hydrolase n=1 Tax=Methylomonas paludis TaxID=1173101 RepID=A0A975RBH2_9GAMM|nr:HAD-IA family hydrolase [Methylomonas paludis]QWF72276.1 HAD-IA family hydrolase [Methylomonas paludis]
MPDFKLDCVLFDLDGTLVDTAPDLVACLNRALDDHGYAQVAYEEIKPLISFGALPMIKRAAPEAAAELQQRILTDMLDYYQLNIATHSRFYQGMQDTLAHIEMLGLKWGVVTNKRQRFTDPLMAALQLSTRAACIISGDSTPYSKPHPAPMLAACEQAGVKPENCVYIGDAAHDISAGKTVNMKTLVALYGYIPVDGHPHSWGANAMIEHPQQLQHWISATLCL